VERMDDEIRVYQQKLKENINILINENRLDEAKELLNHYEKIIKDDIELYSIKAVIFIIENKLESAEHILLEGLKIDCNNFDMLYNLAYVYELMQNNKKAYQLYERLLTQTQDNNIVNVIKEGINRIVETEKDLDFEEEVSLDVGKQMNIYQEQVRNNIRDLINTNNLSEAKILLDEYEDILRDDIEIYSMKAVFNIVENNLEDAKKILSDGLLIDPTSFDLLYNTAYVYSLLKDNENTIIFYLKALKYCKDDIIRKEIIEILQNDYKIKQSDIYHLNCESNTNIIQNEFEIYKKKVKENIKYLINTENLQEVKRLLHEYEGIVEEDIDIYSIKTIILVKENNIKDALKVAEQGLNLDKNNLDLLFNVANIYDKEGQVNLAYEYYKKALIASNSEDLKQQIQERLVNLQKKINENSIRIQQLRSAEFQKRMQNIKYASKQKLIEGNSKSDIHIVYALTHVGVCGGVKIILEHANYLNQLGAKVTLVSHFPRPTWFPINVDYIEVPFEMDLAEGIPDCDVIVATYWDHIQACIDVNKAPVVYFEQGDFHLFDANNGKVEIMDFVKIQYSLPQFITTVSNRTASKIKNIYGRESVVFPNAVSEEVFNTDGVAYKLDQPYILMMGSDETKFKGIDDILSAYRLIKKNGYDLDLVWITPNRPTVDYSEITKIFINPNQQTIAELYRGAWMYVSGSHYESFSLPCLEAMSCGCPVVTTENIGVTEYAKDRYNAILARIGDYEDIANKMIQLNNDTELRSKLIVNGCITSNAYKWSDIIPNLLDYYRSVAKYKVKLDNSSGIYKQDKVNIKDAISSDKYLSDKKNVQTPPLSNEKISVIMPVYNGGYFLKDAIDSILKQTERNFELIIINDGSTDNSESLILSYSDSRIKYIKQDNAGEASARNKGLEFACGEYIVFQDADDVSLPMRLETLKRHFYSPQIGLVHSDMLLINEHSEPLSYWASQNTEISGLAQFFLKVGTPFNNPSMMIRRSAISNFIYDTSLKIGTDTHMVFQISSRWESIHISKPLYLYRRHQNNVTRNLNYEKVALHVRRILEDNKIEDFFPELDLKRNKNNESRGVVLISLFFARRGMFLDAQIWLDKAMQSANYTNNIDNINFVKAIKYIITGDYTMSLTMLESCSIQDHIIENYLGEVKALLGKINEAYKHFLKALDKNPLYQEPVENLKAIGKIKGYHQLDVTWNKLITK
jgi:glycosyltransferase involved in cell wall biosynthesis/Tfp pilus assembly protein PilF